MSDITLAPPINSRTLKRVRVPASRVHGMYQHRVRDLFKLPQGGKADVVIVIHNNQSVGYIVSTELAKKVVKGSGLVFKRTNAYEPGQRRWRVCRFGSLFTRKRPLQEWHARGILPGQAYQYFLYTQPSSYDLRMLDPNLPPLQRGIVAVSEGGRCAVFGNVPNILLRASLKLGKAMAGLSTIVDVWHWGEGPEGTNAMRRAAESALLQKKGS